MTFSSRLAISTDSGSSSEQDCVFDSWSRGQWKEVYGGGGDMDKSLVLGKSGT